MIETLFARFLAQPRFVGFRRVYAGAVLAAAIALVGLSLLTPRTNWEVAEGKVADQASANVDARRFAESLPLVQARTLLTSTETLAKVARAVGAVDGLRASDIQVGPILGDSQATIIRVRDQNPGRAAAVVEELSRHLAATLNSTERTDVEQHRQQLADRAADARSRVKSAEQSLALLLSDFRSALAQVRSAPARVEPQPQPAPPKAEVVRTAPRLNPEWAALRERSDAIRRQLEELLVRYTENNPRVQLTRLQLEQLELQMRGVPQYLTSSPNLEPPTEPGTPTPATEQEELPIAGRSIIRRTSGELPLPNEAGELQRYVDEFAVVNALLEKARGEWTTAQEEQTRFEQFTASFAAERFLPVGTAVVVRRVQSLPTDLVRMLGCMASAGGLFFALAAFRTPRSALSTAAEVSSAMGLPVIVSVVRHGSPDDRRDREADFTRFVILAAEFAVVAIVTAFTVSYFSDAEFAQLAGRDPFTAVAAIWNRSLRS